MHVRKNIIHLEQRIRAHILLEITLYGLVGHHSLL